MTNYIGWVKGQRIWHIETDHGSTTCGTSASLNRSPTVPSPGETLCHKCVDTSKRRYQTALSTARELNQLGLLEAIGRKD